MQGFADVFMLGWRATLRHWRAWLPLYIVGLLLGLVQTWPLLGAAARGALSSPFLGTLADGGIEPAIDLFLSDPGTVGAAAGLWALGTFVFTLLFGVAYNFFAGGILNAYLGGAARSFWSACRRTFWSFTGLGLLIVVLALLMIVVGAALGGAIGQRGALIVGFILLQIANMLGEYARALAVAGDRRNPFVLFAQACGFCARHPAGTLALASIGVLLHLALVLLYRAVADPIGGSPLLVVWQQLVVLAWLWVKLLRLAWAAAYVRAADGIDTPLRADVALPAV
jgi:hypothetical protein